MSQERKPIILCHAACTGGSLIYRLLISAFNFLGISEVSHVFNFSPKKFIPLDPESQLYAQGVIDSKKFSDIFFNRICHCNDIAITLEKKLLIREHSHSYFFRQTILNDIDSISWIEGRYKKIYKRSPWCLLSVRDPIDSWLGLRQNFSKEELIDFNTYCDMYMNFLSMSEKTENIFMFKYEDMVKFPENTLLEISKKINISFSSIDIEKNNYIQSSGNSGRCSSKIYIRPRRPFTKHLVDAANSSLNYKELCEKLGYEHLREQLKKKERILMFKYKVNNFLFHIVNVIKNKIEVRQVLD